MSETVEQDAFERVAVVGAAGRFPGAADIRRFWQNLRDGVESIAHFTEEEMAAAGVDEELLRAANYVRARGSLEGIELFDAAHFGFTPREAEIMEPQFRFFIEQAWAALEDAAYDPETYEGLVGIFGGMSMGEYLYRNLLPSREVIRAAGGIQLRIFNDKDFLSSLVAYKLNLKGPTVNVQSACSTSLVAVHLACQALLSYQCDMALAGGVSVTVPREAGYIAHEGVFSPDGRCRAFDAGAQGTVSGNAVGVVVLKRLADALADGDHIRAVIRGSAINNDGSLKVGYTAPSLDGQAEVIALAQAVAGVEPETVSYIEAHGTGTPLGDPIEVGALTQVFAASTDRKNFCALGSVKTNIGHADAAAGVASLIKTVLALEHKELPPSLHFERPNPQIDFDNSPFYVNARLAEWRTDGHPRRAGVSAFAIGGINAHIVLEEAPEPAPPAPSRRWQLVLLSARTPEALEAATDNLAAHLRAGGGGDLADVAYTLQTGRRAYAARRAVVCRDAEDLLTALETRAPRRLLTGEADRGGREAVFMFPGLGNHYVDMGRELYRQEPTFRAEVDRCCELLRPHLGSDLRDVIYPGWQNREEESGARPGGGLDLRRMLRGEQPEDEAGRKLNQTAFTQPALFVVEYALARLWMSWGVSPRAHIGYSIGEYVAACLAGVFSLEDALALVAGRAQLIERLPAGAMLAVHLSEEEVRPLLGGRLSLAAVNGPAVCVVAGPVEDVGELERDLAGRGVTVRRLQTTHAFHSRMMEPLVEALTRLVGRVELRAPETPVISNVTGTWLTAAQATDPGYWATHLCRPVLFGEGLQTLWQEPNVALLEVGPGQALGAWALQHPDSERAEGRVVLASLRHSYDDQPDLAFLLNTLGRLWLAGVRVDWKGFYEGEERRRVSLPTYPYERKRHWIEPPDRVADATAANAPKKLERKTDLADWLHLPAWKQAKPLPAFDAAASGEARAYLIFLDECGVGARLAARLAAAGQEVFTVRRGAEFARAGAREFVIHPTRVEDYESLLACAAPEGLPQTVVHLWAVTPEEADATTAAYQEAGFYSLISLAQAFGNRPRSEPRRVVAVSNGLHSVTGDEWTCPAKATLLGPCRVIPQEYVNITCQSLDVIVRGGDAHAERLTEQLLAELFAEDAEPLVAYRGGRRWTQTFEPVGVKGDGSRQSLLKERGVYLITGGMGGIGLTLARHLARTVRARLVLTGRSTVPAREEWDEWLAAHGPRDAVSRRIVELRALEEAGAEVLAVSADVTSRAAMAEAVAAARARFDRVDGVIHAAGVSPGGMIQVKAAETAAAVLAPKVEGTLVLEHVFRDAPPDFLLFCSSLNSFVGSFGLVDHCAANAFLDAYAHDRASRGGPFTLSVNWGAWLEVGQAANAALSAGLQGLLGAARPDGDAHPVVGALVEDTPERAVFEVQLSTAVQWFVNEHRLAGRGVVPGTGYLEMARAAFAQKAGGGPLIMRNVFFTSPLVVEDGEERAARVTLTRRGDGFEFRITSRAGASEEWHEHASGQVARAEAAPAGRQDLPTLLERLNFRDAVSPAEARGGRGEEERRRNFGPRWTTLRKKVRLAGDEALQSLELPEEFAADLDTFQLHPSMLDAATGFVQLSEEGAFLPLAYGSLRFTAPLTGKIYSHAKYRRDESAHGEVLVCDLLIMDEEGNELVEIEEYTLRRVTSTAAAVAPPAARPEQPDGAQPAVVELAARAPAAPSARVGRDGILPSEGAEVFDLILRSGLRVPQLAVSNRDLQTLVEQSREFAGARVWEEVGKLQTLRAKHPRPNLPVPFEAPRSEVERDLAGVWQEVLGVAEVGIHDNFFDLGGDSLLATQLIGRVGDAFAVNLSLRALFAAPTIAELSVNLVQKQAEQVGADDVAELLAKIKQLSPEEVQELLEADRREEQGALSGD